MNDYNISLEEQINNNKKKRTLECGTVMERAISYFMFCYFMFCYTVKAVLEFQLLFSLHSAETKDRSYQSWDTHWFLSQRPASSNQLSSPPWVWFSSVPCLKPWGAANVMSTVALGFRIKSGIEVSGEFSPINTISISDVSELSCDCLETR